MCLAGLSLLQHERFPLILAANRDEYFARPASPLGWWSPRPGGAPILSGRDLEAGGTWLGLNAAGRLALLTNVREPSRMSPTAPSRGALVTDWLESIEDGPAFWNRHGAIPYNGFNLIAADLVRAEWFWGSNRASDTVALRPGLYGLSNAALDTPWPKVTSLKRRLAAASKLVVDGGLPVDSLIMSLFGALADRSVADASRLPSTGVPAEWEKLLSPAFIDAAERGYGTRCSTVIITERVEGSSITHVYELTHSTDGIGPRPDRQVAMGLDVALGGIAGLRRFTLPNWP